MAGNERPSEDDVAREQTGAYDLEGGRVVFTAAYLVGRGSCCGSGCRHCPYNPRHVVGNTRVRDFLESGDA